MKTSDNPYRKIVENIPDGMAFLYEETEEGELRYQYFGGEGVENIGLTKEEVEGRVVAKGRPPEIQQKVHTHYRKTLNGEETVFEIEVEGRHFRFKLIPLSDETGATVAGIGMMQDITEEVVYQETLEQQNKRLEQFTELISHDIKSPLQVAQGRLEMLKDECGCDNEHIEPIANALDRIASLTEIDPTESKQQETEALDPVELEAVASNAWKNVATRDAELRVETEQTVYADESNLRRLFENLYRNAVEHGGVDVTVTVGKLENGFYIADDGEGISTEETESLFERGITKSKQGSGLGLFIVKNVVDGHNWRINVTNSEDGGARFGISGVEMPDK